MLIRPLKAFFVEMLILWFSSAALGCQPQKPPGKADAPLAMVDATALVKKTVSFRQQCMIFWNNHALLPKAYGVSARKLCETSQASAFPCSLASQLSTRSHCRTPSR